MDLVISAARGQSKVVILSMGLVGIKERAISRALSLCSLSSIYMFYYILLSIFAYISVINNFDETSFLKYEYRMIIHIIPLILSVVALNSLLIC